MSREKYEDINSRNSADGAGEGTPSKTLSLNAKLTILDTVLPQYDWLAIFAWVLFPSFFRYLVFYLPRLSLLRAGNNITCTRLFHSLRGTCGTRERTSTRERRPLCFVLFPCVFLHCFVCPVLFQESRSDSGFLVPVFLLYLVVCVWLVSYTRYYGISFAFLCSSAIIVVYFVHGLR